MVVRCWSWIVFTTMLCCVVKGYGADPPAPAPFLYPSGEGWSKDAPFDPSHYMAFVRSIAGPVEATGSLTENQAMIVYDWKQKQKVKTTVAVSPNQNVVSWSFVIGGNTIPATPVVQTGTWEVALVDYGGWWNGKYYIFYGYTNRTEIVSGIVGLHNGQVISDLGSDFEWFDIGARADEYDEFQGT